MLANQTLANKLCTIKTRTIKQAQQDNRYTYILAKLVCITELSLKRGRFKLKN